MAHVTVNVKEHWTTLCPGKNKPLE